MRGKFLIAGLLIIVVAIVFAFKQKNKSDNESDKITTHAAASPGIRFIEADFSRALAEAKKQHKLIFLDAYASWCGPCKLLKKNTFPDKAAGDFFNTNFINVAIDMEKGDGPALIEAYEVNAFPTLIITDEDGNLLTYTKGYISPQQLIDFGKHGLLQIKK